MSPASPVALDRPAGLVLAGDAVGALADYRALATSSLAPPATRELAAWRAAELAAIELDRPQSAVRLLLRFAIDFPQSERRGPALAHAGRLLETRLGRPAQAARAFSDAARVHPQHPQAGSWLLSAGDAWVASGAPERSQQAYQGATQYASTAAQAWLAVGRIALQQGDADRAYAAYGSALDQAGPLRRSSRLARLGMATALERLEQGDAALAQVDEAAAAPDADLALRRRLARLKAQQDK